MRHAASALLILLAAGCARSEEASFVTPSGNQGYNEVGRVETPKADDREPAIGQWRASLQENVQVLEFGPMGTEPLFSFRCTGNRSVMLQRHGGAPAGPLPEMLVTRGDANHRLAVAPGAGTMPMLLGEVSLQEPIVEALGAEGEPLFIRLGDGAPLVLPPSPLIADYLRSCATAQPSAIGRNTNLSASATDAAAPAPVSGNSATANDAQPKQ